MNEVVESKTVVLTPENAAAFYAKKLDLEPPKEEVKTEEVKAEEVKVEEKTEENTEVKAEEKTETLEQKEKKGSLKVRFSELTGQRDRERERAEAAEARAKAAEERAAALEAKSAPKTEVVEDGKPDPEKYTDAFKYAEDLAKWTTDQALAKNEKERVEKEQRERAEVVVKTFRERQDAFKTANPDYEEVIASAEVQVTNEMRDEIVSSEVGPQLLYHFAHHPEDAERLSKLTVGGMLRELGKLEARLESKPKESKTAAKAEVSKAPAPITPLNGGKAPAEVPMNSQGEFTGSYSEWKALRKAGKIH